MKVKIYTDGACSGNPGPGGWGGIINYPELSKKISGYKENTTNNQMELLAVISSLEHFTDDIILERVEDFNTSSVNNVEVISDSAYVINAMNNNWLKGWKINNFKTVSGDNVKNKEMWLTLLYHLEVLDFLGISVKFIKVKGHNGDHFNEVADELARNQIIKNRK